MAKRRVRLRRTLAVATSALVTGTAVVAGASVAEASPVSWGPCDRAALEEVPITERHLLSCAKYPVPVDHADPGRGTVDIAMMRRAAPEKTGRIGSLFLNPASRSAAPRTPTAITATPAQRTRASCSGT